MKTYKFKFTGRQAGAIGKVHKISATFKGDSLGEAMWLLYCNYEHITIIEAAIETSISLDEYNNTELVKPKAFYTAEDTK